MSSGLYLRITYGHGADYRATSDRPEISFSLTGHCEEVQRADLSHGDHIVFDVIPVPTLGFIRRTPFRTYRVAGRPRGRPVVELVFRQPRIMTAIIAFLHGTKLEQRQHAPSRPYLVPAFAG